MKSSINVSKENNKENESAKPNPIIDNIKSRYILSKIYNNMTIKKKLEIVKYNKKLQNRTNLSINDYKLNSKKLFKFFYYIKPYILICYHI